MAKTITLYFPNEKEPNLELEVSRDGLLISATAYCPFLDCWLDCFEHIEKSVSWQMKIQQGITEHEADHDDWKYEQYRDSLADIKEALKPSGTEG